MSSTLGLSQTILQAVQTHARDAAPGECVGLLFGHGVQVTRSVALENRAATPRTRFFADPQELFAALSIAEAGGETLLAIYHSHPGGAAFPSETDIAAAQYAAVQLIVTPAAVRAFRLRGETVSEVALILSANQTERQSN